MSFKRDQYGHDGDDSDNDKGEDCDDDDEKDGDYDVIVQTATCSLWMILILPSFSSPGTKFITLSSSPPLLLPSSTVSPPLRLLPAGRLLPKMYRMNMHCTASWWIRNLQSLLMGPSPDPLEGKGVFCTSNIARYLLMIGPAAVESGKQPGMKLSGGFPSRVKRCSRVFAQSSVVLSKKQFT